MAKQSIIINSADNVAVAVCSLSKGETHEGVTLTGDIPQGHKFALTDIAEGDCIIKCGAPVARAICNIPAGAHVHSHNAKTSLTVGGAYTYTPAEYVKKEVTSRTVNVYHRDNGDVGIRNELWIVPITGSVNGQAKLILKTFKNRFGIKGFDGAFAFSHPYGDSQAGADRERTKTILQKMIRHPNAGGVLVLGLGGLDDFRFSLGGVDTNRIKFLDCREAEDEIESGVQLLNLIAEVMRRDRREPEDISCLKIGLKCGGSDWLSDVTANPLAGKFCDYLISAGGTVGLCEVPEMFGAEQTLMNRANCEETFEKIVTLLKDFKNYFRANGQSVYVNPSPELMAEGVTTIEEKSIHCTQKAGSTPVQDVVFDKEFITQKGLNLVYGPDNDMCAVTNLAVSGCHLILFTTGKGTPFGGIVPTVKISSNTKLSVRKSNWIDFNAGAVLDTDYETQLEKLIGFVAAVAGGKLTKNEISGTKEMAILKTGITL